MHWIYRLFRSLYLFTLFINIVITIFTIISLWLWIYTVQKLTFLFSPSPPFTCIPDLDFIPVMFLFANTEEWAGLKGWRCPLLSCPSLGSCCRWATAAGSQRSPSRLQRASARCMGLLSCSCSDACLCILFLVPGTGACVSGHFHIDAVLPLCN